MATMWSAAPFVRTGLRCSFAYWMYFFMKGILRTSTLRAEPRPEVTVTPAWSMMLNFSYTWVGWLASVSSSRPTPRV